MPDSKITALTALTAADPAVDMFPVVDVSDTTMAASGTTKRISINNILACSPAATLASATITGDLTVDTNVLKVDSAGNRVSVNTTTFATDSAFAVKTTAGKFDVRAAGSLSVKLNSDQSMLYNVPTGNLHLFQINDADAMTLNATGLAIGDTAFAGTRLTLRESASQPNALAMTNRNATQTWRIGVDVSAVDDKILGFYDSTSTTFRMQLTDTGNLGIGVAPSAGGGCLQLKSGITFPATQVASSDANTLDDYEEGTWTIGFSFGGASTGITYVQNTGKYTKVGRLVTVFGAIDLSSKGSSTGNAAITGLPFAVGGASSDYSAASLHLVNITFADFPMGFGNPTTTTIPLQEVTNAGVRTNLTDADFANNSSMIFSLTYSV